MKEHAQFVSGIDWCAKTNLIVTCSHDRNAYVWKEENGEWKPTLVVLRISRAATDVKWSPSGDKFAVTSGAKCVPVCHFDGAQNWWISKMIKKHKSTVLSVDWSPNSKYVVTGACDFKCRVFSAFLNEVDTAGDDVYGLGAKHEEFGECLFEYDHAKAWVNSVAWAPDGLGVAFVGQGSTLSVANFGGETQTIFTNKLPFLHVGFGSDNNTLVAVGFDNNPTVYKLEGSEYKEDRALDPEKDGKEEEGEKKAGTARSAAFAMFQAADSRGSQFGTKAKKVECFTYHKNTIIGVQFHGDKITTSSYDGRILSWDL